MRGLVVELKEYFLKPDRMAVDSVTPVREKAILRARFVGLIRMFLMASRRRFYSGSRLRKT